ncbi:MAG: hypothetical protein AAF797_08095 [Planctomycetota bacterium]
MKTFLTAMKANPLTAAAALVALASVGVIVYYLFFVISGEATKISEAADQKLSKIRQLSNTTITIPADDPNKPPRVERDVVNDTTIEKLKTLFATLNGEREQIIDHAIQFNRGNRPEARLIRDDIFPAPRDEPARINARDAYRSAMIAMLGDTPWREGWPALRAGQPLDRQTMTAVLERHREDFIGTDLEKFEIEQRKSLKRALFFHTSGLPGQNNGISIYADTDPASNTFPFRIFDWAQPGQGSVPTPDQLWEAQLELWIVSDIVEAIMRTNRVGETFQPLNSEGQPDGPPRLFAVQEVPVKNLIELSVVPGYVGLHTAGGLGRGATPNFNTRAPVMPPNFDRNNFGQPGAPGAGNAAAQATGVYGGAPEVSLTGQGESPVPENFYISPTGRGSNAVFDVRHARLVVDVDWLRLNELLDQLAETNLITVLKVNLQDVDERTLLAAGYHYGPHDVVRAEILLETLWMREWTTPLMPEVVKTYLGVPTETRRGARNANASRTITR